MIRGGCERNVHPFAGAERFVQYRQALLKRQHLHIIHNGKYELTDDVEALFKGDTYKRNLFLAPYAAAEAAKLGPSRPRR